MQFLRQLGLCFRARRLKEGIADTLYSITITASPKKQFTQVRSPAVLLRLARCTSWVKRWSEAMDFETIFKINIFLSRILGDLYGKKTQEFDITYVPVVMNQK